MMKITLVFVLGIVGGSLAMPSLDVIQDGVLDVGQDPREDIPNIELYKREGVLDVGFNDRDGVLDMGEDDTRDGVLDDGSPSWAAGIPFGYGQFQQPQHQPGYAHLLRH